MRVCEKCLSVHYIKICMRCNAIEEANKNEKQPHNVYGYNIQAWLEALKEYYSHDYSLITVDNSKLLAPNENNQQPDYSTEALQNLEFDRHGSIVLRSGYKIE